MNVKRIFWIVLSIVIVAITLLFFFLPVKESLSFTETRTTKENIFYVVLEESSTFEIRYVHSIHLTDVIEFYEVADDGQIQMHAMSYENLSIGLPGEAGEGETIELKDGIYTLTYENRFIDSFRLHIGRVDADLALRYKGQEFDLKSSLEKGKSYEFAVKKLTYYQLMKGEDLNDSR